MKRFLISLATFILMNATAYCTTYYADGNLSSNCAGNYSIKSRNCSGNDGNAYRTIAGAMTAAIYPGDTIDVRAGTYTERNYFTHSGSADGGYITLQAHGGEKPIISGSGLGYGQSGMLGGRNVSYIKIQGLEIANYDGAGIVFYGSSHYIQILNNELHDQKASTRPYGHTILVTGLDWPSAKEASDITISGNYIHNVVTGVTDAYNEALTVAFSVDRVTITNNTLHHYSHIGIDLIGKTRANLERYLPAGHDPVPDSPWPRNVYISGNNVSYGAQATVGTVQICAAIYVDGAQYVVIENNTAHSNIGYGIVVSAEESTFAVKHAIVRRNKSYNNSHFAFGSGFGGTVETTRVTHNTLHAPSLYTGTLKPINGNDIVFKNNISYSVSGQAWHILHSQANSPKSDYNLFYPADTVFYYQNSPYLNFSTYKTGSKQDAHSLSSNPDFRNISAWDFRLWQQSPAIDAGGNLTSVSSSNGTGTSIVVADASYFSDGFGISDRSGDQIMIGSDVVTITKIDYDTNTISFSPSISWVKGEGVDYLFSGTAPDMGAYEHISTGSVLDAPLGLRIVEATR